MYQTLISTSELFLHLNDPEWAILDCRFTLDDSEKSRNDYEKAHIPGALYAHLNEDLSGAAIPGVTGRHPLPDVGVAAQTFARWGIGSGVQVVAYDDMGGSLAAARAWWIAHWMGHAAAAVLDGGWQKWLREGRPVRGGLETRLARRFEPSPRQELLASTDEVELIRQDPTSRLFDARSGERYCGQNETIDPVGGHIPGAVLAPRSENLNPDGVFLGVDILRDRYQALLGDISPNRAVFYCGSGVTATHNILAMQHAGLGWTRLYVGSWSEWITDPQRPIATGDQPG
jgi:thiosulfate/3-mercaptopyruvate sulfurtransferase